MPNTRDQIQEFLLIYPSPFPCKYQTDVGLLGTLNARHYQNGSAIRWRQNINFYEDFP